mgnify:CR=1 FL=1
MKNRTSGCKYIVVTGGVLSGLGKGIAAASIGNLLSGRLKVVSVELIIWFSWEWANQWLTTTL